MAMFRLVKSVGRLPNVIYVLAFDRPLAEKLVAERFPSEGPHYLEKIVQASFDLPDPLPTDLQNQLLSKIGEIAGHPEDGLIVHFMNLFHEVVSPEIQTPRDAIRFGNALSITLPAVEREVDLGDFLALEAYRLFRPSIHQAIRRNQSVVCGSASMSMGRSSVNAEQLDALLLSSVVEPARFRKGLIRVFPKLESIWANTYGDHGRFAKQRRACVAEHFPTYFRLSLSDDVVPRSETNAIFANVANKDWMKDKLRLSVRTIRKDGGTRVALILDALNEHAKDISISDAEALLSAVFSVANEIDVENDRAKGFSMGDNNLRIHWLLRALTRDRTDLSQRSRLLMNAADGASLGWLVDLANSGWNDYNPRDGKEVSSAESCLLTASDANKLEKIVLNRLKIAAKDGALMAHQDLAVLLYRWRHFADDNGKSVRLWTDARLKEDHAVARFASAFTSHSWGQSMDDLVAKRSDRAQVSGLDQLMDGGQFRTRIEGLDASLTVGSNDHHVVNRFLKAWDNKNRFGD